ncbi:hypothetical protein BH09SUM1_BH09SUM1_05450 [soil metagenome]
MRAGQIIALLIIVLGTLPRIAAADSSRLVNGKLNGPDGIPAAFVTVLLEVTDNRIRRQIAYDRTTSGVDGTFTFDLSQHADVPSFYLQFNTLSPTYTQQEKLVKVAAEEFPLRVDIDLTPGSSVKGRVLDENGKPVAGAMLRMGGLRDVKSDDSGNYELLGIPATEKVQFRAFKKGYADDWKAVQSTEPSIISGVDFVLSKAGTLGGKAIAPDKSPVTAGVVFLQLKDSYQRQLLSSDGTFEFTGIPMKDFDGQIRMLTADYPEVKKKLDLAVFDSPESLTLTTEWPLKLSGRVLTPDGSPSAGSEVFIGDGVRKAVITATTDAAGLWTAKPLTPGERYIVSAMPAGVEARNAAGDLAFLPETTGAVTAAQVNPWPSGAVSKFEVQQKGIDVTMVRHDEGVGGLPGAVHYTGKADAAFKEIKGTLLVEATGAKGDFIARAYEPSGGLTGTWDFRERIGEGSYTLAPAQKIVDGAPFTGTQICDLSLAPSRSIHGKALLADGSPVLAGTVSIERWNETAILPRSAAITAGGEFTLGGLPDGIVVLRVMDDERKTVAISGPTRPGTEELILKAGEESASDEDPSDEITN